MTDPRAQLQVCCDEEGRVLAALGLLMMEGDSPSTCELVELEDQTVHWVALPRELEGVNFVSIDFESYRVDTSTDVATLVSIDELKRTKEGS